MWAKRAGALLGMLTAVAVSGLAVLGLLVLNGWVVSLLWGWVVPDVFGGLVKAELLPGQIGTWQATKLLVLVVFLLGLAVGIGRR